MSLSPKRAQNVRKMAVNAHSIHRSGDKYIDLFRIKMMERAADGGFNGFRKIMRIMDNNRDHKLSIQDFLEGMENFGVKYNPAEFEKLFNTIDREGDGYMSLSEFIRRVRPEMSMRRQNLVLKAFSLLDVHGTGGVLLGEMKELYDPTHHPEVISGHVPIDEILREFANGWDKDDNDIVTQDEFMEYYSDIGANILDDDYFELMVRNTWHVSGGEENCRNTSCLRVQVTLRDGRVQVTECRDDLRLNRNDIFAIKNKLTRQGLQNIEEIVPLA